MISIPKRVVGLSTQRSRLKRLIREAFRRSEAAGSRGQKFHFMVQELPQPNLKMPQVLVTLKRLLAEAGYDPKNN